MATKLNELNSNAQQVPLQVKQVGLINLTEPNSKMVQIKPSKPVQGPLSPIQISDPIIEFLHKNNNSIVDMYRDASKLLLGISFLKALNGTIF